MDRNEKSSGTRKMNGTRILGVLKAPHLVKQVFSLLSSSSNFIVFNIVKNFTPAFWVLFGKNPFIVMRNLKLKPPCIFGGEVDARLNSAILTKNMLVQCLGTGT